MRTGNVCGGKAAEHEERPAHAQQGPQGGILGCQCACQALTCCMRMRCRSVGVQGDQRTHSSVVALRAVTSGDGMTADWYPFQPRFLQTVSARICNGVRSVNRVVYDVTSKPPGTIEWE